jgi:hypothetical protein
LSIVGMILGSSIMGRRAMMKSDIMCERLGQADCFCVPSSLHLCCACAESTTADGGWVGVSCPWPVWSSTACRWCSVPGARQGFGVCAVNHSK